ncbi:uncharacterized protein LOC135157353 [Lytechinus pictus]|uniref:uncharacterized protein LOC135157353 n=1 Tax=Lytechinus pictus TaxID=7653 RepID=UPI0030BA2310
MVIAYPCIICCKNVYYNQNALLCVNCTKWCHLTCSRENMNLFLSAQDWICPKCYFNELPGNIFDEDKNTEPLDNTLLNNQRDGNDVDTEIELFRFEKGMRIAHLNCISLTKNLDEIRLLVKKSDMDILTLSETHLNENICDTEIGLDNFDIIRKDRNRSGGGIAIYIKSSINYSVRNDITEYDLEMIVLEIKRLKVKPFFVVVWYRPPNSNVDKFNLFENVLLKLDRLKHDYVILGDINCDMLATRCSWQTKHLQELMDTMGLAQVINSPTRVTATTSTLVDLILTNNKTKIRNVKVVPISLSDHYMICCIWGKQSQHKDDAHKYKLSRNIGKINMTRYDEDIRSISWESVYNSMNVKDAYDLFEDALKCIIDKHAPLKRTRVKKIESPWINEDIIQTIRKRNEVKNKAKHTKSDHDWASYRRLRNDVTAKIRKAKKDYISTSISSSNGQSTNV